MMTVAEKKIRDAWNLHVYGGGQWPAVSASILVPHDGEVLDFRRQVVTQQPIMDQFGLPVPIKFEKYERVVCSGVVVATRKLQ